MTGRYPFNLGFYGDGKAQHITNYTTTAELLSQHGYTTSAIGKWDVGYVVKETELYFLKKHLLFAKHVQLVFLNQTQPQHIVL